MGAHEQLKIAILGRGKTGSELISLLKKEKIDHLIFSRENPVSTELLKSCHLAISFLPGDAFLNAIPLLLESGLPCVTGSTGFDWPADINKSLSDKKMSWIHGHNFSLGMNLVHQMITVLAKAPHFFGADKINSTIHEIHHDKKLDSPSGTAIKWQKWLGIESTITSERTGDIVGEHYLKIKTPFETISLGHQAHDRQVFAAGAWWAALLLKEQKLSPGLHYFEQVALKALDDY